MENQNNSGISPEAVLPILTKLSKKYTSNESTSVPYETAQMLLESIWYCIAEFENYGTHANLQSTVPADVWLAYEQGRSYVLEKTRKARETYDRIMHTFTDYGCQNYHDTIVQGIPQFFLRYDPVFAPGDHLLTLDYPTLQMQFDLSGIDLIHRYLEQIETEQSFLTLFPETAVRRLLDRMQPDYSQAYFDNLCYPVLLTALGSILADRPLADLTLTRLDCQTIFDQLTSLTLPQLQDRLERLLSFLMNRAFHHNEAVTAYFLPTAREYALRIHNTLHPKSTINYNSDNTAALEHLFSSTKL